jgi:hypothetical protein
MSSLGVALPQDPKAVVDSMRLRGRLRALQVAIDTSGRPLQLEAAPDTAQIGETLLEGQRFGLAVNSSVPAAIAVIHVNGDGGAELLLPARTPSSFCRIGNHLPANILENVCTFQGAAAPFGLDLLYVFAWEGEVDGMEQWAINSGGGVTAASVDALSQLVSHHQGRVAAQELRIFTVKR